MAAWYSGILPYQVLFPIQILILAIQIKIGSDLSRGEGFFVMPRRRWGTTLRWFSYIYCTSMLLRYIITRMLLIPIVFHWVLAAYLFVLGHFHATRDSLH